MKKSFIVFSFIACATFSSVWGDSLQAQHVVRGGCFGFPFSYTVVRGDTLSAIAASAYGKENGTSEFYTQIAEASNIDDPNFILVGQEITIPCPREEEALQPRKIFVPAVASSVALPQLTMTNAEVPALDIALETDTLTNLVPNEQVARLAFPSFRQETSPSERVVAMSTTPRNTRAGRYEFELAPSRAPGITAGTFPALSVANQEKSGLWRKETETVAVITKTETGKFAVEAEFKSVPTTRSAIAIDLGEGNLIQVAGDVVAREGKLIKKQPAVKLKKQSYAMLKAAFVKKPSKATAIARRTLPIAIPAAGIAGGFALAGPIGAIWGTLPLVRSLVMNKAQSLQRQAQQPDQISKLNAKIAALEQRLDSLGQTETATIAKSETNKIGIGGQ